MRFQLTSAIALIGLLGLPAGASAHEVKTRACGQVAFTPDSEDLAANIRATGLTCGLARDFVRDSEGRPDASFRGFRCRTPRSPIPRDFPTSATAAWAPGTSSGGDATDLSRGNGRKPLQAGSGAKSRATIAA